VSFLDCWDAEIQGSYGWIEVVGIADRSAFDLRVHTQHSKVDLSAQEVYAEPKLVNFAAIKLNPGLIGKTFSGKTADGKPIDPNAKHIMDHLKRLEAPTEKSKALALREELAKHGKATISVENSKGDCVNVQLEAAMVEIKEESKKVSTDKYIPSVIEPSFGLGRILYHILEHSYYVRPEDEQRGVLALPALLAGQKVKILPISAQETLEPFNEEIFRLLTSNNISATIDATSAQLGRRYARAGKN
jgi:glycyl-tRNA synthetase